MTIELVDKTSSHPNGVLHNITLSEQTHDILFLFHAKDRMKKWGITDKMVVETLLWPEEVLAGHRERFIAHRRYGDHVVRAVYEYQKELPVLVTVYFPYVERYFQGGGIYENKIFKGSGYPSD